MVLDSEQQRENLLTIIQNVPLAQGTMKQLKPQIEELEALEQAVKTAIIPKVKSADA